MLLILSAARLDPAIRKGTIVKRVEPCPCPSVNDSGLTRSSRSSARAVWVNYVLFFIHLESRRVSLAGITRHPDQAWMQQMARNATGEEWGFLEQRRYVLHDRDTKFCSVFRATMTAGGIEPIQLPLREVRI